MKPIHANLITKNPVHNWLKQIQVYFHPAKGAPLVEKFSGSLLQYLQDLGHQVVEAPTDQTDLIITTAKAGDPVEWRKSLLFTARKTFGLRHQPQIVTILNMQPDTFETYLKQFSFSLSRDLPDPQAYQFPGIAPTAYQVLHDQGSRGGPILAFERLIQAQTKCIRLLVVIGKASPKKVYHFDLVGAHPITAFEDERSFYEDIVLRLVTVVSTAEINNHQIGGETISKATWDNLVTPEDMRLAARELGARNFFTQMVRIADLITAPMLHQAISAQYSEGCFATWDPELGALISTVTGSARPIEKDQITDDDLAVITGIREDQQGAIVRHVEGKKNDPPSTEAVELMIMDQSLPRIQNPLGDPPHKKVPVIRSKLHGHRGISSYNPDLVEQVFLPEPYYHYPVSCGTEAQSWAIQHAFSESVALRDPDDPRQLVFTILPGHGVLIAEKWIDGKRPFEVILDLMDKNDLAVTNRIPQGPFNFRLAADGRMEYQEPD